MAPVHDFKPSVRTIGIVDGEEDGQVLDVFDVGVGRGVDVRGEASAPGEFVIDLLFEEEHGPDGELREDAEEFGTAEDGVEARVAVCEVLGAAEDSCVVGVDFLRGAVGMDFGQI